MLKARSHCRFVAAHRWRLPRLFLSATLLLPALLSAGVAQGQDCVWLNRDMVRTWALHDIAVIQAAAGDVMGAKTTLTQIDDEGEKPPVKVTPVWFNCGRPVYVCPPEPVYLCPPACAAPPEIRPCAAYAPAGRLASVADARRGIAQPSAQAAQASPPTPGWGAVDPQGHQYFLTADRPPDCVSLTAPADLPSDYLAPDPRHGPVVDFTDDHDRYGTRVTSRRYADGHSVIETLHNDGAR